jgi:hypothetical protein
MFAESWTDPEWKECLGEQVRTVTIEIVKSLHDEDNQSTPLIIVYGSCVTIQHFIEAPLSQIKGSGFSSPPVLPFLCSLLGSWLILSN